MSDQAWPRGSFLGNAFRAVTGVIGGAIGGFITKGPAGAIAGAVGGAVGATKANIKADSATVATSGPLAPAPNILPMALPTNSMGVAVGPGGGLMSPAGTPLNPAAIAALGAGHPAAAGARGYHPNKSWTYSRRTGQLSAPGTKMVRNRRMNWANGRALGKAEHRIRSAVKHMTRYIRWVHPARAGHAAPKFTRKRK